uniref:ATP synthase F(0) complex subunit e, mitochondrial n=1 Tax=Meloidogyne floridensis TaxID=298350 RepID=A0A915NRV4_9BILA
MSKPHPTDIILPEPIQVSPLIRFARWTALGAGIIQKQSKAKTISVIFSYGYVRFHQIARGHALIREWEADKFIHKVEQEHERAKLNQREESEFVMQVTGSNIDEGKASMDVEHLYLKL